MSIAWKRTTRILAAAAIALALAFSLCAAGPAGATEPLGAANAVTAQAKSSPAISSKAVSMQVGKTTKLKVKGVSGKVTWKSSSPKVASVSKSGKVTARKAGTATITATKGKKKLACAVTVAKKPAKTLVAYFSQSGTTKAAAQKVKAATGGDLLRIYPKKAYTTDYDKLTKLAQKEYDTNAKPARATKALNMKRYSTVYVGFPVWWDDMPRLVQCFLGDYDLKGKTVVPFCTSGGSGIDGSMKAARASAKGATVLAGRDLTGYSKARVKKWVASLAKKPADNAAGTSGGTGAGNSATSDNASTGGGTDADGTAGGSKPDGDGNASAPAAPADGEGSSSGGSDAGSGGNQAVALALAVGESTFTGTFADTDAARGFATMLPATLDMSELNGNEKYCYLDAPLPSSASNPGTIQAGDVMLYGDRCVVVFYKTFETAYSYTRIGHVDPEGLAAALGAGSADVAFAIR